MTVNISVIGKCEDHLRYEAEFYGVTSAALARAILDKVATGGITRDVLQGVDVESYQLRKPGRPFNKKRIGA